MIAIDHGKRRICLHCNLNYPAERSLGVHCLFAVNKVTAEHCQIRLLGFQDTLHQGQRPGITLGFDSILQMDIGKLYNFKSAICMKRKTLLIHLEPPQSKSHCFVIFMLFFV
ncbi:hypothetical protein D3C86_1663040 [compost metagenome]